MRLEKTSLILKMKLGESVTWREGGGRMEKRGGIPELSTNPIIGKKDNNDNNDNNNRLSPVVICPIVDLSLLFTSKFKLFPLFNHVDSSSLGLGFSVVILS